MWSSPSVSRFCSWDQKVFNGKQVKLTNYDKPKVNKTISFVPLVLLDHQFGSINFAWHGIIKYIFLAVAIA